MYGFKILSLDLGLRRVHNWNFVVADVQKPIIGLDFLSHFGLLVDVRNKCLVDTITKLTINGQISNKSYVSIRTINDVPITYHELLVKYIEITRPSGTSLPIKHNTRHFIETTPGPPVASKPRRLVQDKLIAAKKEFDNLISLEIVRPSKSSWASPLHMVPKKGEEWRPCGDYRRLDDRTIPDRYPVRHIEDFTQTPSNKKIFQN